MAEKIKKFEEARISVDHGYAEIHIAETSDGTYNITINEHIDKNRYPR